MTIDELARIFRVAPNTVRGWIADGMPVQARGRRGAGHRHNLDLQDAFDWWLARNRERLELMRAQTQLASAQAHKMAMANQRRMSELGAIDIWQREVDVLFAETRAAILELPARLAPLTGGDVNQRKERIESAVHDLLRRLAHG